MTDYGSIIRDYESEEEREAKRKERERKAREAERKRVDNEFEEIVMKSPEPKKRKTCSANSDLIKYTKHLKAVRTALKAAANDGYCLDEIMDGLKELGDE